METTDTVEYEILCSKCGYKVWRIVPENEPCGHCIVGTMRPTGREYKYNVEIEQMPS